MPDRDVIESLLRRVQAGELSYDEAFASLIQDGSLEEREPLPTSEPLERLVSRLGPPPNDIADHWCEQVARLLSDSAASNQARRVDSVAVRDFVVEPSGKLAWHRDLSPSVNEDPSSDQNPSGKRPLNQMVAEFRRELLGVVSNSDSQASLSTVAGTTDETEESNRASAELREGIAPGKSWVANRSIIALAASLVLVAVGGFVWQRSNNGQKPAATAQRSEPRNPSPDPFSPKLLPTSEGRQDDEIALSTFDDPQTLAELESLSDADVQAMEAMSEPQLSFSLDSFMPSSSSATDPPSTAAERTPSTAAIDQLLGMTDAGGENPAGIKKVDGTPNASEITLGAKTDMFEADSLDPQAEDGDVPSESLQPTRQTGIRSVTLPAKQDTSLVRISETPAETWQLDFPIDSIPITLSRGEGQTDASVASDGIWEFLDAKRSTPFATIQQDAQGLGFRWSDEAVSASAASQLHHGRLQGSDQGLIYLRPAVEADPWRFELSQADVRPTWELTSPILASVTRMSVDLDLPDELELTWVEVIPSGQPRRAQGAGIVQPADGESVAIGISFDIRCGRKISSRIRFAGRLNSAMPWQLISRPGLDQLANRLTAQAAAVAQEQQRLDNVYQLASSRGKRVLRIKQQRNEALAQQLKEFSDRVATLRGLVASFEAAGQLRIELWTEWPSGRQTIFNMGPGPT